MNVESILSNLTSFFILRGYAVVVLFWLGVSIRVDVNFRLGLTLSLKLTIPNLNLTYFGVRPVIATGKNMQKNTYRMKRAFDKQIRQKKRE